MPNETPKDTPKVLDRATLRQIREAAEQGRPLGHLTVIALLNSHDVLQGEVTTLRKGYNKVKIALKEVHKFEDWYAAIWSGVPRDHHYYKANRGNINRVQRVIAEFLKAL